MLFISVMEGFSCSRLKNDVSSETSHYWLSSLAVSQDETVLDKDQQDRIMSAVTTSAVSQLSQL